jgi:hypothetical protein
VGPPLVRACTNPGFEAPAAQRTACGCMRTTQVQLVTGGVASQVPGAGTFSARRNKQDAYMGAPASNHISMVNHHVEYK